MRTVVWITTEFEGFHRWKDAPAAVEFLRNCHRHIFKVKLAVQVTGLDRQIEFIQLKSRVNLFIASEFMGTCLSLSCEQIAEKLLNKFEAIEVRVSEDGENGATVYKE
jgi:hypothetical protein